MDILNNIDVVTILKVGPPGLVFLLALFAFYLLLKEGGKDKPKQSILKAIHQFMVTNITFAILTIGTAYIYDFFNPTTISCEDMEKQVKSFDIEAQLSSSDFDYGKAAVCSGADYGDKHLLIVDPKTKNMIQVYGMSIMPCNGKDTIFLDRDDAVNLGWPDDMDTSRVLINAATKGQKFVIDYQ